MVECPTCGLSEPSSARTEPPLSSSTPSSSQKAEFTFFLIYLIILLFFFAYTVRFLTTSSCWRKFRLAAGRAGAVTHTPPAPFPPECRDPKGNSSPRRWKGKKPNLCSELAEARLCCLWTNCCRNKYAGGHFVLKFLHS